MYYTSTKEPIDENLHIKLRRELNLKALLGNYNFEPKLNNLVAYHKNSMVKRKLIWGMPIGKKYIEENFYKDSEYYDIIKKITDKYDVIVTGSVALRIFGVLDRKCGKDIDLIATKETIEEMKKEFKEFKYVRLMYGGMNKIKDLNLEMSFEIDGFTVDMFVREDVNYVELENIKVSEPFDVMIAKIEMKRDKDITDTKKFLKKIKEITVV